jgi:hypothetical protein
VAFGGEPFALLARARFRAVEHVLGRRAALADTAVQGVTFGGRALAKALLRHGGGRELAQLRALRAAGRPD